MDGNETSTATNNPSYKMNVRSEEGSCSSVMEVEKEEEIQYDDTTRKPCETQQQLQSNPPSSYCNLLIYYPQYRYFLISYIVTQLGEWLTYVASLSILELANNQSKQEYQSTVLSAMVHVQFNGDHDDHYDVVETSIPSITPISSSDQKHFLISMLVVCRLIPNTLFSFAGGILADTCDRRIVMYRLDILGGCVAIIYFIMSINVFHHYNNNNNNEDVNQEITEQSALAPTISMGTVIILFLCTIAQSGIAGLYEPSRSAIVPLLVQNDNDNIEKANEIAAISWSLIAAIGSSLSGFIVNHAGVAVCFATDTILYFCSAIIIATLVRGNYSVQKSTSTTISHDIELTKTNSVDATKTKDHQPHGGSSRHGLTISGLLHEVNTFITKNGSAPYLLIKGCGALLFGASDVINVTIAQDPETGEMDPQRLGYMFTAIGIGCLLGPVLMPTGRCYLTTCIGSYFVIGFGYGFMALSKSFWWKCVWTSLRASGSAVLWVDSSILLQTTTPSTLLGRVSSIDYAIALLGEAASAMFAGIAQDKARRHNEYRSFYQEWDYYWAPFGRLQQ